MTVMGLGLNPSPPGQRVLYSAAGKTRKFEFPFQNFVHIRTALLILMKVEKPRQPRETACLGRAKTKCDLDAAFIYSCSTKEVNRMSNMLISPPSVGEEDA